MKLAPATLLIAIAATALFAHDYSTGALTIDHPVIYESPGMARTAAGYMTITNDGDSPERLIGVRAEGVPTTMLHESVMDGDIVRMEHLEAVVIAPGESVAFDPGGKHVMFMGLDGTPLVEGDEIAATLIFDRAGEVDVTFTVEPRGDADHTGH